jgi:hypothetical protein
LAGIIQNGIAADLTKDPGEIGIGLQQPTPERDSIGFVDDPVGYIACSLRNTVLRIRLV